MQRSLIIAAALAGIGASAFAQSTVTLYGRVNITAERQKIGAVTTYKLEPNSSRWGLRGSEDLGGGMKAGFGLESGFDPTNGTVTPTFWSRQSEVNLSGSFGMVRLGKFFSEAYFAIADYVSMHNHDTGTSSDALYAFPVAFARSGNKIAYRTPSFGGATFEAAATAAEGNPNRTYDMAANYQAGPLHLGAGYEKNGNKNQFAVRGLYELGALTFGGYVQRDKNAYASGNRTTLRLSAMYAMGNTELHANVGRAGSYSNLSASSATQFTLGVNQNLSKRTKVYGYYTKIADSNRNLYGGDFSSLALGLRHNF